MYTQQLKALIEERAPHRPWCGYKKNGAQVRPLAQAIKRPYMQLNPPGMIQWLVLDIDQPLSVFAWERGGLPPPTYVAVNRENEHAHIGYALETPVCTTARARKAPQHYLAAIRYAYNLRAHGDFAFHGPLAKNPLHKRWHVVEPAGTSAPVYELGLLADYVDLPKTIPKRISGIGRNVTLFENLGHWAYRAIRAFWRPGGEEAWRATVLEHAWSLNTFAPPLGAGEVKSIAKSVARFTWKRFNPGQFSNRQATCGRRKGALLRAEMLPRVQALLDCGCSQREAAGQLGVPRKTIAGWLQRPEFGR